MGGWFATFLNATVGLDTTVVTDLGYELEPSPLLDGALLVINNPPPTTPQWVAVTIMLIMFAVLVCHYRSLQQQQQHRRRQQIHLWSLGLLASCFHNVDNIIRPGTYFTPYWIVEPKVAFAMDQGFLLWMAVAASGVLSLRLYTSQQLATNWFKPLVLLHSIGTSFGIAHYVAQTPRRFSVVAHVSILFEVIMGIVVGWAFLSSYNDGSGCERQVQLDSAYDSVPIHDRSVSVELPQSTTKDTHGKRFSSDRYTTLRQRSKSPRI